MKKYIFSIFVTGLFTLLLCASAFALEATFDTTDAGNGVVAINLTGISEKEILVQVSKDGENVRYKLVDSLSYVPLQLGAGDYTITVLENVEGNSYMAVNSTTFNVAEIDEAAMFTASIVYVNYEASEVAIPLLKGYADGKETNDQISVIYTDVIENISYDTEKAIALANANYYIPVIDDAYDAKKGICFDYSAILGGALRSLGIPTKLVWGYVPEIPGVFHAWNEILIDGEWIAVDTTYDASAFSAGAPFEMAKDRTKTQVVRYY